MSLIEAKTILGIPAKRGGRPFLNENTLPSAAGVFDKRSVDAKRLMDWVMRSPEPLGIVQRIARDTVTKATFRRVSSSGRPSKGKSSAEEKAVEFYKVNFFRQQTFEAVIDCLITGDLYLWKGKASEDQVKEVVNSVYNRFGFETKELEYKQFLDENFSGLSKIQHVPSTTMSIDVDEHKIKGYVHKVTNIVGSARETFYSPDEIIHGVFMRMDGRVHGFTPMFANESVIQLNGLIKDYAGNYFVGGGAPDLVIAFEESLQRETKEYIEQRLEEYKDNRKRGHMVMDGSKVHFEKLNEFNKDMEFHKLAVYLTGVLAHSFNMPSSFLGPIIGSIVKASTGGVDSSEGAYWKNIRAFQEYLEDLFNTQLWIPLFGVEMSFEKPYLIDEIKESQNLMMVNDALTKTQTLYAPYGRKLKMDTLNRLLGFEEDDFEEMSSEEKSLFKQSQMPMQRQGQPDNKSIKGGSATDALRSVKKTQAG